MVASMEPSLNHKLGQCQDSKTQTDLPVKTIHIHLISFTVNNQTNIFEVTIPDLHADE